MIEEIKVLVVRCDTCKDWLHDDAYNIYFPTEETVDETVTEQEWSHHAGSHLCPTCTCETVTGHALRAYKQQGYRSCDCGELHDKAITIRDPFERV